MFCPLTPMNDMVQPVRIMFLHNVPIRKTVKNSLTDQREVNRTKTRKNRFSFVFFGFRHVFPTGRFAAKNSNTSFNRISLYHYT